MPNLRKIEAVIPTIREKKKVAAYARVSMQSERMRHSLSAQVSYYSDMIQKILNGGFAVFTLMKP